MPRKKKVKSVTVAELQAFLDGAMAFNDVGWVPDAKQWGRIVEMIKNIVPDTVETVVQSHTGHRAVNGQTDVNIPRVGSSLDIPKTVETPVSMAPRTDLRKVKEETIGDMSVKDENGVVKSGKMFRGPNRDDSKGLGDSEFE